MYYTYIAYNKSDVIRDIGTTNNLRRRCKLFSLKYKNAYKIVYFEEFPNSKDATLREEELKKIHKSVIEELVTENNPMLINLINS